MLAVSSGATLQQREIMSLPMDKKPVKRVGTSLGILVQDGGHSSIKLLLNHNEASLQLVTMKGNQNAAERHLNKRVLKLDHDTTEIIAEITVTENRVIQLKAWDPKHTEQQVIIQADQNSLTEAQMENRRKLLGISEKTSTGSKGQPCNGVQREHNKKLNNGLPILHKVPPKRDYGRYFCIMAEKGGTSHGGLTEKLSPFFHAKKQEVNAYGR